MSEPGVALDEKTARAGTLTISNDLDLPLAHLNHETCHLHNLAGAANMESQNGVIQSPPHLLPLEEPINTEDIKRRQTFTPTL
ncbi:hypothetical protein RRG08_059414 [Elysia crispata]|uniref:Uncharacterized protein n=1 Tax=Elysia crispata TaxID=231223 RepID=A0AAE0Z121_9GAST|nr:hypothetical protein RRG08_059414 [Elysia crispata]